MATTEAATEEEEVSDRIGHPLSEFVDWAAAAVIAIAGLGLTVGGSALTFALDRDSLAEGVESGQITVFVFERDLTRAEMLDFSVELVTWTGIGLLVTGVGSVLFAIGYVVARHRAHQRTTASESAGSYRAFAVLGAVTSSVLSFVPFSPVIGGGLAGYLERDESGRSVSVGALSGFLYAAPTLVVLAFVTVGLYAGLAAVQESGLGIVTGAAMLLVVLFVATYGAGLGALGGFAGARLADRRD